jgi:hypothetical protein
MRFERVLDPCDLWLVWDNLADQPAELDGDLLIGLADEKEALWLAALLNGLVEGRTASEPQTAFPLPLAGRGSPFVFA